MRALIQRVTNAHLSISGEEHAAIKQGIVILLGVGTNDTPEDAHKLANKTARLRIFSDEAQKMNLSVLDTKGEALVVSQFTLYANTKRGNRPSFEQAAPASQAKELYELFVSELRSAGVPTRTGVFQSDMLVTINNDGPVTIILES